MMAKIGKGTYGAVYKAIDLQNNKLVAMKKMFLNIDDEEGIPSIVLREIQLMKAFNHPNIL